MRRRAGRQWSGAGDLRRGLLPLTLLIQYGLEIPRQQRLDRFHVVTV